MKRPITISLIAAASLGVVACGGKSYKTADIPSGGETVPAGLASTTPAVPQNPALAKKPKITVPKGPPPKHLVIKDLVKGTGKAATNTSTVTVHYVGTLTNGSKFDSSRDRNEGFTFKLGAGQVIKGWDQGIPGMKIGGRRELIIPASLAYGKQKQATIPANSALIFVIDLQNVS